MITPAIPTKATFAAYNLPSAVRWLLDKATCQQARAEEDNVAARFVFEGSIPFRMLQELRAFLPAHKGSVADGQRCLLLEGTETAEVYIAAKLPTYRNDTTVRVIFRAMYAIDCPVAA